MFFIIKEHHFGFWRMNLITRLVLGNAVQEAALMVLADSRNIQERIAAEFGGSRDVWPL